ncbi:MAG: hypothetical protein LUC16_01060 [Coprobacillus sp.]|nr:hypothetical protein [Coprobacillus sp.]
MKLISTYGVTIREHNRIFRHTVHIYRDALAFFIDVAIAEWEKFASLTHPNSAVLVMERITHATKAHPVPEYDFDTPFPMFPTYLRRAAIMKAVGAVSAYKTKLATWEASGRPGQEPGKPMAGNSFPVMYKDNMYSDTGRYSARIKIYDGCIWKWLDITFRKSDVDYIKRHCPDQKRLSPTLIRRGKKWNLRFSFEKKVTLNDIPVKDRLILSVDLGVNNACVCTVMSADGAVHGRKFLKLPVETDRLWTAINRIKKAQQHGARKTPRLWEKANGINRDISAKTAAFIMRTAELYSVNVIVFEYLDLNEKKRGSKKQQLHLWKARDVQRKVEHKALALGMRISRVNAWNTSRLAFDGSGFVKRGMYMQDGLKQYNYSVCVFQNGKTYNCDLNAAYNIGARYFVREILKSLPETARLALEAKVPSAGKRSTSTLSTLFSLNAELALLAA